MWVCVAALAFPEAGSSNGWRARGHLRVRALLGGVRVAGQRTRGEDGRRCTAREPHKDVAASAARYARTRSANCGDEKNKIGKKPTAHVKRRK